MDNIFKKHKYGILLIVPGVIGGYLYWRYIGCNSGTCPITSNWYSTVFFGGLLGYFLGDSIDDKVKQRSKGHDKL